MVAHAMRWRQRFGVLIEALLLRSAGNLEALGLRSAADLLARHRVIGRLTAIALRLQSAKRRKEPLENGHLSAARSGRVEQAIADWLPSVKWLALSPSPSRSTRCEFALSASLQIDVVGKGPAVALAISPTAHLECSIGCGRPFRPPPGRWNDLKLIFCCVLCRIRLTA